MANLELPPGVSLDTLFTEWPDEPLPHISAFSTLAGSPEPGQVRRLVDWIEPQQVCAVIMKHHGSEGLQMVLKGIAEAASKHKVPMNPRVRSVAEFYGLKVY